ncbi:hypothetical protein ACFE04_023153 [Oxalis oulophora]
MVMFMELLISVARLRWVFVACFICASFVVGIHSQSCNSGDLSALKEFSQNLTNLNSLAAWSNESLCCKWEGVMCGNTSSDSSRVTKLILPKMGLKGAISNSLGNLSMLKWLDLSDNNLEGGLPIELSKLDQLEALNLSHNSLSGNFSGVVSGLKSIQSLNISSNLFNGSFSELGGFHFPYLVVFDISDNFFSGAIGSQICRSSPKIQILDLSMNRFTGSLMEFQNCSASLQQLHLDFNLLSGHFPDELYSKPALTQLSIAANNVSGQLSYKLSKLSKLQSLIISGNQFHGELPNVFGNLTQLEFLSVDSNSFSGQLPSSLALCSKLQVLDLRNNSLNGSIELNFTGLRNLSTLDLASNHFSGSLPNSLSNCQILKILSLAKNNLAGQIPNSYGNLTSLVFLSLSSNNIVNLTGALSVLQHCKNLTTLILTRNFASELIPHTMSSFQSLRVLALGNCGLKGQIPAWLLNCEKLQVLDLSWNHLDGNIPSWIGQMEHLFYIDFSNNTLSGEMPRSLTELRSLVSANCSLSNITTATGIPLYVKRNQSAHGLQYNQASSFPPSIYLSNNQINGTIMPEIGRLKELHILDLSRNNLSGTIPSSISEMENLEALDLSYNDLFGSIPKSLEKLTFLSRFSVAHNQLEGVVPSSGQFSLFPSSSFDGNPGLCGEIDTPCHVNGSVRDHGMRHASHIGFGRGIILSLTISVGLGILLLFAAILFRNRRRHVGRPIDDLDEEFGGPRRFSESKLVLFQNSECKDITVTDLLKATNNFNQANIIGCGGFGLVYKADFPNGTKAAIKRLSGDCGQLEREFQAEVEALSRAQHKNLVSLQGYCQHGNDRLLIYSYMENGSLDYWLHENVDENSVLKFSVRLKIGKGAARGLSYLHEVCQPHIVHRDVKTSNILLDQNFEAHLADFGLSRLLRPYDTHVTTDLVGTLGYIPPEYSQTLMATCRGDVYSFGVVLLELVTGRRPVEVCKGKNCRDLVSWVFQMKSEKKEDEVIDSSIWDKNLEKQLLQMLEIACKCLDKDPRRRPTIEQVVSWLDDIEL